MKKCNKFKDLDIEMVSQKSAMPSEHPKVFIKKYLSQMARDIGRGYIKFSFTNKRYFLNFMKSRLVVVP